MSDDEFFVEPVPGHIVRAETYQLDAPLYDALDEAREQLDMGEPARTRVRIQVGDVDWDEPKEVTMRPDVFEQLVEWYDE